MAVSNITTSPRRVVTIPAERISDLDLLDGARDKLRTVHAALNPDNKGALDDETLFSIWAAIRFAMNDLDHLRDHLCD